MKQLPDMQTKIHLKCDFSTIERVTNGLISTFRQIDTICVHKKIILQNNIESIQDNKD